MLPLNADAAMAETLKVFLLLTFPIEALKFPNMPIIASSTHLELFVMINRVRFRSVTRIDRESPYRLEAIWNRQVSIGLNASPSAKNSSRLSYSPEAINSLASPTLPAQAVALRHRTSDTHCRPLQPAARTDVESQPAVQAYRHQRQSPIGGFPPMPPNAKPSVRPPSPNQEGTFYL